MTTKLSVPFYLLLPILIGLGSQDHAVFAQQFGTAPVGWSPVVIASGAYRDQIKSMPIEQRPNRPLHFYGNSVRRNYYRGVGGSPVTSPQAAVVMRYSVVPSTGYPVQYSYRVNTGLPLREMGWGATTVTPYQRWPARISPYTVR